MAPAFAAAVATPVALNLRPSQGAFFPPSLCRLAPLLSPSLGLLSILSRTRPEIVLQQTPSELERQIGVARRALGTFTSRRHQEVQGVVSKWIGVEQAVERASLDGRISHASLTSWHFHGCFRSSEEHPCPGRTYDSGLLYVGVSALTGSIFARNRRYSTIRSSPDALASLIRSLPPKTYHNLSSYLGSLEDKYLPAVARNRYRQGAHRDDVGEDQRCYQGRSCYIRRWCRDAVHNVQDATGLSSRRLSGGEGCLVTRHWWCQGDC